MKPKTFAVIVTLMLFRPAPGQTLLNDFDAVLPQVAKGIQGSVAIETTIVIVNPSSEAVTAELTTGSDSLLAPLTMEIPAFERREVKLSYGEVVASWVRVRAKRVLSVSAVIVTREVRGVQQLVSQATVLAQPLATSVVIPVFHRSLEIENTGIAVYFRELGLYAFELYDASGVWVADSRFSKQSNGDPDHLALFVNELFEVPLPESFVGWIRIRGFEAQARGFAAMALYTTGARNVNAPTTIVDAKAAYLIALKDQALLEDLRSQYGFDVIYPTPLPSKIYASDEVARALERDSRDKNRAHPQWAASLIMEWARRRLAGISGSSFWESDQSV